MMKIKIGMISLGCSKNRVDSELMLGKLKGIAEFTSQPSEADVVIVNTCGFIESAKQESIDTILEMAEYKKQGLKGLIVTGCLSQRYQEELIEELPEVDAWLGVSAYEDIADAVLNAVSQKKFVSFTPKDIRPDYKNRMLTTPPYTAYVKISEGCDNRCTYCAIPYIRGNMRSRTMEGIKEEVDYLTGSLGVSEIILVAQDTTKYGLDLYGEQRLCELIELLAPNENIRWLRLLYAYPESVDEKLIHTMMKYDNVVKYLDIPVQHFNDSVLKRMNRKNTYETTKHAVKLMRDASEDFIIRTTLIAGFPGETEEEFQDLLKGIKELKFDRLGVFAYSQEDGTPAAKMKGQLDEQEKQRRAQIAMEIQAKISEENAKKRIGRKCTALIEYPVDEGVYAARTYAEAPEIDGLFYVKSPKELIIGDFVEAKITGVMDYDMIGEIL